MEINYADKNTPLILPLGYCGFVRVLWRRRKNASHNTFRPNQSSLRFPNNYPGSTIYSSSLLDNANHAPTNPNNFGGGFGIW
jgi:hypothetical protein